MAITCAQAQGWELPTAPEPQEKFNSLQELHDYLRRLRDYYGKISKPRHGRALAAWDLPSAPTKPDRFKNPQELQEFYKKLYSYYDIVGKPRLGRDLTQDFRKFSPQGAFLLIDTDKDGSVSFDEFEKLFN